MLSEEKLIANLPVARLREQKLRIRQLVVSYGYRTLGDQEERRQNEVSDLVLNAGYRFDP